MNSCYLNLKDHQDCVICRCDILYDGVSFIELLSVLYILMMIIFADIHDIISLDDSADSPRSG